MPLEAVLGEARSSKAQCARKNRNFSSHYSYKIKLGLFYDIHRMSSFLPLSGLWFGYVPFKAAADGGLQSLHVNSPKICFGWSGEQKPAK